MVVRPVSPDRLVRELADRLAATRPAARLRVAVDGPAAAEPGRLAEALTDPLRVLGRPVLHVRADDFLKPASVRLEPGRTNPDAFYERLDDVGLRREVLAPAGSAGSGRVLPTLWDAATDRASRVPYVQLPANAVVLVSGSLLLGGVLPFDLTVHLVLSPAALRRRTRPDEAWTLPAYDRYHREVDPAGFADVVVRLDDPRHPALVAPDRG
ncbi:MAG TPA: uridine kinase [Micromonosporaceae bacterium]